MPDTTAVPLWQAGVLFFLGVLLHAVLRDVILAAGRRLKDSLSGWWLATIWPQEQVERAIVKVAVRKLRHHPNVAMRFVACDDLAQYPLREDAFEALCEAVWSHRQHSAIRLHAINVLERVKPRRRDLLLGNIPSQPGQ